MAELDVTDIEVSSDNKSDFLRSSETSQRILDSLNLDGFQLGGGAIDFALGKYRRPHGDVDVIYVVDSVSWKEYVQNPSIVPEARESIMKVHLDLDLHGVQQSRVKAIDRVGVPGFRLEGGDLPLMTDFIEAYKHIEGSEEYIMLPRYEGDSFIKIPTSEIHEVELDGVKTSVPSAEVLYVMRKQK